MARRVTETGMSNFSVYDRPRAMTLAHLKGAVSLFVLSAAAIAAPARAPQTDAQQLPPTTPQIPYTTAVPEPAQPAAEGEAPAEADTTVVTGFRSSLRASRTEKRNADGVIDVIK